MNLISGLLNSVKKILILYQQNGWVYTKQKIYDYFLLLINQSPTALYSPKYAILDEFSENGHQNYSTKSLSLVPYWQGSLSQLKDSYHNSTKYKILLVCSHKNKISKDLKSIIFKIKEQVKFIETNNFNGYNKQLLKYDFIVLDRININYQTRLALRYVHSNYIPVINWQSQENKKNNLDDLKYITNYCISYEQSILDIPNQYFFNSAWKITVNLNINSILFNKLLSEISNRYQDNYLPKVTVFCISNNDRDRNKILDFYSRQSYTGEIELVLIDRQIESTNNKWHHTLKNIDNISSFRVITIEDDFPLSQILNIGSKWATGNIVFIHYIFTTDYNIITNHVTLHSFDDCEISIDYFTSNSNDKEYDSFLKSNAINSASFLSFSHSNIAIKKDILLQAKTESSFLEKDNWLLGLVELGYILYSQGKRFKLVLSEVSNQDIDSINKQILSLSSLDNFLSLVQKYSEFKLVCRRWRLINSHKLVDQVPNLHTDNKEILEKLLNIKKISPLLIDSKQKKSLRILTYPWHIPHQYEIYKLPYKFTLITDLGSGISRGWNLGQRPIPDNVEFQSIKDINIDDFDLAILHFDENILSPEKTNGALGFNWGNSFRYFKKNINLPKIAICHGTPQFYGQYDMNYQKDNLMQVIEEERKKLREYLGDILTITNSYQANKEWNFKNTKVIWHGFDPLEFPKTTYSKGILTPFGTPMISRPHYRGYYIFQEVFKTFLEEFTPNSLNVKEPHVLYQGNQYAYAKFRNYVDDIRQYSIYFNPTIRSPMPRSRGEAMMCGLVNVSLKNHDVDLFIENGVNGFYSEDPEELRDILLHLVKNPQEAQKIGNEGRKLAMDIFNYDRFLQNWNNTINEVISS